MSTALSHVRPAPAGQARPTDGWLVRAACRALPTELFFPAGELDEQAVEQAEEAKSVCSGCPVQGACLEYAIATNQPYGIWGGANASERRSIRRRRQAERRRQAS
ncbi:MAG: WhiB family transcriptional regulator [Acidimicrobiales bacterium]